MFDVFYTHFTYLMTVRIQIPCRRARAEILKEPDDDPDDLEAVDRPNSPPAHGVSRRTPPRVRWRRFSTGVK
jgi:hypothetical protein